MRRVFLEGRDELQGTDNVQGQTYLRAYIILTVTVAKCTFNVNSILSESFYRIDHRDL